MPAPPSGTARTLAHGMLLMLLSTFTTSSVGALAKFLLDGYTSIQVLFFRCIVPLVLMLLVTHYRAWISLWKSAIWPTHVGRALINVIGLAFYISSLAHLPLAEVTALSFTQPIFVAALSQPILGERVNLRCWAAIAAGFVGTLIMLRPGMDVGNIWSLAVLCGTFCWALSLVLARQLTATESTTTITAYVLTVGAAASGVSMPVLWIEPGLRDWLFLIGIGVVSGINHFTTVEAYRRAPAAVIAPLFYATMIWTTAMGYLVWGETPDRYVICGAIILLLSGVYLGMNTRRLAR